VGRGGWECSGGLGGKIGFGGEKTRGVQADVVQEVGEKSKWESDANTADKSS